MYRIAIPLLMMILPRFVPQIIKYIVLIWKLTSDKRVNIFLRALVPLAIIYLVVPFDMDRVPIFGRFDDIIVLGLAVFLLIKLSPRHIVDEHLGRTPPSDRPEDQDPSNVIDGTSRPLDE